MPYFLNLDSMSPTNSNQNSSRSTKNESDIMDSPRHVSSKNNNKFTGSTTTSSSSTSGFVSGIIKNQELILNFYFLDPFTNDKAKFLNRNNNNPYEASAWWNNINSPRNMPIQPTLPNKSSSKYQQQFRQNSISPELSSIQQRESPKKSELVKPLQKAIRMDIDFNRPISPELKVSPERKPQPVKSKNYIEIFIYLKKLKKKFVRYFKNFF